jgi:hypothetical protein
VPAPSRLVTRICESEQPSRIAPTPAREASKRAFDALQQLRHAFFQGILIHPAGRGGVSGAHAAFAPQDERGRPAVRIGGLRQLVVQSNRVTREQQARTKK